jgi:hypothetical protein
VFLDAFEEGECWRLGEVDFLFLLRLKFLLESKPLFLKELLNESKLSPLSGLLFLGYGSTRLPMFFEPFEEVLLFLSEFFWLPFFTLPVSGVVSLFK